MCQTVRAKEIFKNAKRGLFVFFFVCPFTAMLSTKCGTVTRFFVCFFVAQTCQVTASLSTENGRFSALGNRVAYAPKEPDLRLSPHTAQALLIPSTRDRRRVTRLLLLFLLDIKVVICLHSLAKSALRFVLLQKYWSNSGRKGLASAFTFT